MDDLTAIAYWKGRPLSEVPRDELEAALSDAYRQIKTLHESLYSSSVAHIGDLARLRKLSPHRTY